MKINPTKSKLKRQLNEFTQPAVQPSSGKITYRHRLSGNYEIWRLARFIFSEILSFRIWDQPFEKVNWSIPFVYQGKYSCSIVHEKFGFRIYVSCNREPEAQRVGEQIEAKLHKTLMAASPIFEKYAEDALLKGEIVVSNKFEQLRGLYDYFRKKSLHKRVLSEKALSASAGSRSRSWYNAHLEKEYFEQASYFSFFSMLEHLCVLFLAFRNIPGRKDVAGFSRMKWNEKFKLVFDIKDPEFKNFYDHFIGLARYQRNPAAHGHTNTVFDFYLEGARHKVSVTITEERVALPWRDQGVNFATLESFLRLIKKHRSTKNIFMYINAGLNVSFMKTSLSENDQLVGMSSKELRAYINYTLRVYDDMANMDW